MTPASPPPPPPGPRPAYFSSLTLDHIRCFGSGQTIKFTDAEGRIAAWTLILGENGVGKTTALQSLLWMRPQVRFDETGRVKVGMQGAIADLQNPQLLALAKGGASGRFSLRCEFVPDGLLGSVPAVTAFTDATVEIVDHDLSYAGTKVQGGSDGDCPDVPVFYYGAGRRIGSKNIGRPDLEDPLFSAGEPIASPGDGVTEMYDPVEVLWEFDVEASNPVGPSGERARALMARIRNLLVDLLPDLSRPEDIEIGRPGLSGPAGGPSGIRFETPYGSVPLEQLSFGYRTSLTWALDLARRLVRRYPEHPDPLSAAAVVLVDEIDLHLHPRWQREIRETLLRLFPAAQFIVTAHSPLMAQDAEKANVEVLRRQNGEVQAISNPHVVPGARLDQVMSGELFNIPPRSKATEEMIERRRILRGLPRLSATEAAELSALDERFAALPDAENAEDQAVMDLLRRAAATMKPGKPG